MYQLSRLKNGLTVATAEMPHMASVSLGLWVGVGGRYEPAELNGVSHFIEHLLFKGTKKRSAREISQAVEGIGGYWNAFTGEESTCCYSKARHDRLDELLQELMEKLREAGLSEEAIQQMAQEARENQQALGEQIGQEVGANMMRRAAEEHRQRPPLDDLMDRPFITTYSDILFTKDVVAGLVASPDEGGLGDNLCDGTYWDESIPMSEGLWRKFANWAIEFDRTEFYSDGFDDSGWTAATVVPAPDVEISAQQHEPMRILDTVRPVAVTEPAPGTHVFDFGGILRLTGYALDRQVLAHIRHLAADLA